MNKVYPVLIFLCVVACGPERLAEQELREYLADPGNNLARESAHAGTRVEVIFWPTDLVFGSELAMMKSQADRNEFLKQYEQYQYFLMRFSSNGQEIENQFAADTQQFQEAISYLDNGLAQDVSMVVKTDTLRPEQVSFVRSYGMAGASSVLVVFKTKSESNVNGGEIVLSDSKFGTGLTKYAFDPNDIKKVPQLFFQ